MKHMATCVCLIPSCLLSFACTPAARSDRLAIAPGATARTTAPTKQIIRVDCEVLEKGKPISRPALQVESGLEASIEVGHAALTLLGHEIPDGIQTHLTATRTAHGITINGEMLVSRRDDGASASGPDGTWILQRAHRWVFEIHSSDPDRWYTTPQTVDGYSLRLRARPDVR